jgi:probable HAF family extracellular repeat protein
MKPRMLTSIIAMTVFAVLATPVRLSAQDQPEHHKKTYYSVKDLGTLGGTGAAAEGISNRSWIVGTSNLAGDQSGHAYLWRDGVMTDLGTLGGLNSAVEWPVKDDRGLIAGIAETSNADPLGEILFCPFGNGLICLGFLWQNGVMTALPTLGGNNGGAFGVNNRGQLVGSTENTTKDPTCTPPQVLDFEAVVWELKQGRVKIKELPPLPGDTVGLAEGINDKGQAVGVSGVCSDYSRHAVLWQNGSVTDLGSLGGKAVQDAKAINSRGQVVGSSDLPGDTTGHAFLWTEEDGMQDLGTLSGDSASTSYGINDKGQVVGTSCIDATFNICRAFLWQDGVMTDLNTLVKPGSTPLYLFFGNDINSQGEIAAYAFDQSNGEFRAAVAIPCDEEHAGDEGCNDVAQGTNAIRGETSERPKVAVPENVREQLRKRMPFGRFGAGPITPQ